MGFSESFRLCSHSLPTPYYSSLKMFSVKIKIVDVFCAKAIINGTRIGNGKGNVNGNNAVQHTGTLLQSLLNKAQKLNQFSYPFSQDIVESESESLYSDLLAVVDALKTKEADLEAAENDLFLDFEELNLAKEQLELREKAFAEACTKHELLEEELKQTTLKVASQARDIESLKTQLQEKEAKLTGSKAAILLQQGDLVKMRTELERKSEEALLLNSELKRKSSFLDSANKTVSRQKIEVQELKKTIREKDRDIEKSALLKKAEEEKVTNITANLEKQTKAWLLVQEEVAKLYALSTEANETKEYFTRVKALLSEVRGSLVSSRNSLTHSKNQMEEHEQLLSRRHAEVEELKFGIEKFTKHLLDGQMEVDKERNNLRAAWSRSEAVLRELRIEKETIRNLNDSLMKEKISLDIIVQEATKLRVELREKSIKLEKLEALLMEKESELLEAKLEIQTLKSEVAKLQVSLSDKDAQLISTRKKLDEVNSEMSELKRLLLSREEALAESKTISNEKDHRVMMIQNDLNGAKKRAAEAETIIERIVELTDELAKNESFELHERMLESELDLARETLLVTEGELVCAKRDLAVKEEELRRMVQRFDEKEKEVVELRSEMNVNSEDMKDICAFSQEMKAGQKMEVEVAIVALQKLVEMSGKLAKNGNDVDAPRNSSHFHQIKSEVCHLLTLTDQLIKQAGIQCAD